MFIDTAKIYLKAGNGGDGCVSFRREKYIAAGGPDGGDGGKGGDIIFVVDEGVRTLADFRYKRRYKAEPGENGAGANRTGRSGKDMIIKVPAGTIVKDAETDRIIADLTKPGQTTTIVQGGKGGKGNQHFATPTRQVPNFARSGNLGEERWIMLELKLLADVGLIGYPNVGKSTILASVSAAKPKIANYHFTTIVPNLGVVSMDKETGFVIADIPGLIEGAHEGVGLGHNFLRHVERTKVLIHVVDVSGTEGRNPIEDFELINKELLQYNPILAGRHQIVAANKMDITGSEEIYADFARYVEERGYKIFPISAATGKGLKELMYHTASVLKDIPDPVVSFEPEVALYTAEEEKPFEITKENDIYIVTGGWVRNLVNSTNFGDHESLQYFQRAIKRRGIIDALEDMGINEGDTVKLEDFEFDYFK